MEIRQVVRGTDVSFAPQKAKTAESGTSDQPKADRLELSRQWVEQMQEQSARLQALLAQPAGEKKSNGILDMLNETSAEERELDALAEDAKTKMKCMEIAMRIMKGKKVPPQDEQYLMEHDPEGYKVAMAMKALVKEDKKECESVLKDEESGETSESEEAAPVETSGEAVSSGGDGEAAE